MRLSNIVLPLAALGLLLVLHPARAAAPKDNCTGFISSVPAVISTPGTWCLSQNLATSIASGDAITVASDDVVIDCNDFGIDGSGAGLATIALAIHATDRNRTIVRHCTVRGFYRGLLIDGNGSRDLVEENHMDHNTHVGIDVLASDSSIRHNLITQTGGSTATPAYTAYGIVAGYDTGQGGVDVVDNTITGVQATVGSGKSAFGIYSDSIVDGVVIRGNRVSGLVPDTSGAVFGLLQLDFARGAIRENELVQNPVAASFTDSFDCQSSGPMGHNFPGVRVKKNVVSGFQFSDGVGDCGDAGRNDIFTP